MTLARLPATASRYLSHYQGFTPQLARSLPLPTGSSPHGTPATLLSAPQPAATAVKLVRRNLKRQKDTGQNWLHTKFTGNNESPPVIL